MTHGSPELDDDAAKLAALGADPGPTLDAVELVDDMRLDELVGLADDLASYWTSLREAAYRRDKITIAVHLRQARLATYSAYLIVKDF